MQFLRQTWLPCFCCSSGPSSRISPSQPRSKIHHSIKTLNYFKNDRDTGRTFSQPPLISFKRDRNIAKFLVRSAFQTSDLPGTLNALAHDVKHVFLFATLKKISGPKRSIKITDYFTCTSANVIYCITCTHCKKLCIGETGRRLGD